MIVYDKNQVDNKYYTKRDDYFDLMATISRKANLEISGFSKTTAAPSSTNPNDLGHTDLRLMLDIHPGGALFYGNCNIDSGDNVTIFAYTNSQQNVNECSKELGHIIDHLRSTIGGLDPIISTASKK